jgi:hypothetical protein
VGVTPVSTPCKLLVKSLVCVVAVACRDNWQKYASQQGGRGGYLRFANMLINDSIYLLDESLKYVKVSID